MLTDKRKKISMVKAGYLCYKTFMKFLAHTFFLLISSIGSAQNTKLQGSWLIELQHKDIGMARMLMRVDTAGSTFTAYTRRHADKALLGGFTALLGRMFTKNFKQGVLLRVVNGKTRMENDTLKLSGIFTSPMGNYYFDGHIEGDSLIAVLSNKARNKIGLMRGTQKSLPAPLENYPALFEKALALTTEKIYSKDLLEERSWKKFVRKGKKVSARVQDDLEMVFAFFYYAGKLPVSHYALMKLPPQEKSSGAQVNEKYVFLEEKNERTACLRITSFSGNAEEMDSVFRIIEQKKYEHLVVDLRNNSGGSVEAGMAFARNVTDSAFYGGVFLTQKWFDKNAQPPAVSEYPLLPHFTESNFDLIIEGIHKTEGLCLKVMPGSHVYRGKLYVLTNRGTASTCEPIAYGLKQQRRAVIVGEQTAGAMLNGEIFELEKEFRLVVPTADYYAADGYRIDQKGVKPDIAVKPEQAMEYVLKNLAR